MASKKQRRRREKLQRHEYEYVVENEEGEEVPVDVTERRADCADNEATAEARRPAREGDPASVVGAASSAH